MFALTDKILDAISQGTSYIASQQQRDGSFFSLSSPNSKNFTNALRFHSTFSTSLILDSLCSLVETPQLNTIKKKAASFLLTQKSHYWSFNYWARNSEEAKTMPYPDDLDDTFCALTALFHYEKKIIDGAVLAHIVGVLTATEENEGGPYRTWLVAENAEPIWKDVDIAVNSNIAYFLSLQEIDLPQLNNYIDKRIETNNLTSPYYPSDYPILYFLSRFYKGTYKNPIVSLLFSKKNNTHYWDNPLYTALVLTALCNFQAPVYQLTDTVVYILKEQTKGFWQPFPFYTGVNPKRDSFYYAGSSALTTALCLQALAKYLIAINTNIQHEDLKKKYFYEQIVKKVEERFSVFNNTMQNNACTLFHTMLKKDTQKQITLLPYYFVQTIGEKKKSISDNLITKLGVANTFGWTAYTIYDDFLDDEGSPEMLSIANAALRELTAIFEHILPDNPEFILFFHSVMDDLDQANNWEVTHCRVIATKTTLDLKNFTVPDYGNYNQLAKKSLGHGLGPIAILFSLGYKENSPDIKNLLLFFTHYLIARQLHDDAHDWEKDLTAGHINSVCALLLKKYFFSRQAKTIKLDLLVPKLQRLFWYTVVEDVCLLIHKHTKKARIALKKCSAVVDHASLEQLVLQYEKGAQLALEERENTLQFVQIYKSS